MKTLGEFLQRLEDDSLFEKKAQAYNNGDELMAFVESEGYDFTLEQLTNAFKQRANLPPQAEVTAPAPPDVSASTPPRPEVTAFPVSPAALPQGETSAASPKNRSANFPREQRGRSYRNYRGNFPEGPGGKVTGGLFKGWRGQTPGVFPREIKERLGGRFVSRP